jgi:quercetin dioxygenase-like cupin family protein
VKVDPGVYKVVVENAAVRVLKVNVPAGGKTSMHQHPDNIVIPLAASKVRFTATDGKTEDSDLASETAMYGPAGSHSGANLGKGPVDALVVEFKMAKPGTAAIPTSRDGMALKVLAEGPRALAYRSTADPKFHEPAGSKHEFDQVVIALGASDLALTIDGKPAKTKWARGDVQFIGRGVAHEAKNSGGKPVDFIIVAIK